MGYLAPTRSIRTDSLQRYCIAAQKGIEEFLERYSQCPDGVEGGSPGIPYWTMTCGPERGTMLIPAMKHSKPGRGRKSRGATC